jgi:hypothetical protein
VIVVRCRLEKVIALGPQFPNQQMPRESVGNASRKGRIHVKEPTWKEAAPDETVR